jgi:putative DNA primase/helicase
VDGDEGKLEALLEYTDFCLRRDAANQNYLVLKGDTATGKSTFCAILQALVGPGQCSAVSLEQLNSEYHGYALCHALVNIATDMGELDKAAEGRLKMLVDRAEMSFNKKYKDPETARPTAKLIFGTNVLPHFSDRSGAHYRRCLLAVFDTEVPEEERVASMATPGHWEARPRALSYLLARVLEAGTRFRDRGGRFAWPADWRLATQEFQEDNNPALRFLRECVEACPGQAVRLDELYKAYENWHAAEGYQERFRASRNTLGKQLAVAFPHADKRRPKEAGPPGASAVPPATRKRPKRLTVYEGVRLIAENVPDPPPRGSQGYGGHHH